jgi:hypothetical protein
LISARDSNEGVHCQQKTFNWFHNSNKSGHPTKRIPADKSEGASSKDPKPPGPRKYEKRYLPRQAVAVQYADRVSERASELSHSAPGSARFLADYPQALTDTLNALSKQEKKEMEQLAQKWNEEGPPDEQKRK